jgi:hypothetical protein
MKLLQALALASFCLLAIPLVASAGPLDTLDEFCGGALSSPGCVATISEFPLEVGAVVGVIQLHPSSFSSAQDCKSKLGQGSALYNDVAPYVGAPGVDVGHVLECSCNIAYSTQTCSGEATKIANDAADAIGKALDALDSLLGLDVQSDQQTYPQEEEEYYATVYKPLVPTLIGGSADDAEAAEHPLYKKCIDEWFDTDVYEVPLCLGFKKRFLGEIGALHQQYEAYLQGQQKAAAAKLQAQQDAQQKAQDAATDNARKTAMNWARIKLGQYTPMCHDEACSDAVRFVAFAYYGKLATGMQFGPSNTQALSATNAQFEPIFQQEIAKDLQRRQSRLGAFQFQRSSLMSARLSRLSQVNALRANLRSRLMLLGVRDPDRAIKRGAFLRARHVQIRGLSPRISSVRQRLQ